MRRSIGRQIEWISVDDRQDFLYLVDIFTLIYRSIDTLHRSLNNLIRRGLHAFAGGMLLRKPERFVFQVIEGSLPAR